MNWLQRLAARWILGKEWAGWIDEAMRSLGKGGFSEAIAASIEENPLKRAWIAASLEGERRARLVSGVLAGEEIKAGKAVFLGTDNKMYGSPNIPSHPDPSHEAPSCVHFRPTMSVDDIAGTGTVNGIPMVPPGHVMFRGPTRNPFRPYPMIPPIPSVEDIEESMRWRDNQSLQIAPKPKCFQIRPDGSMREVPEAEAEAFLWSHVHYSPLVSRPRHDATDPAYLGDMPPHMPYDWP